MKNIRIGFVPAHREPFDEDWALQMRERCLKTFANIPGLEIVVPDTTTAAGGLVRNDGDAENTIRLFQGKRIDGLIVGTMTFGDEVSALTIAAAFSELPILLFGTKDDAFTAEGGRKSDSFCGTLSISSGLYRRKISFIFGGIVFPEESSFNLKISNFVRVCAIPRGFIGARIGLVGPRPERFETCIFNEDAMIRKFKQRVIQTSLPDLFARSAVVNSELELIRTQMLQQADLSALNTSTREKLMGLEYALTQFTEEKQISAIGIQCWTAMQSVYGISPCYVMGRLTDRGIMASCEVDIYGALTMLIQYLASGGTIPPHFVDWTIRHQEKNNVFLAWHCGNAPPSLACKNPGIRIRYHSVLGESLGIERSLGTGEFQVKPGIVTLCRLIEQEGKFKLLISKGEIIPSNQDLRGSWGWVQVPDLEKLYNVLIMEGFTHHASLVHGDYGQIIQDACYLLGIESRTV